MALARDPCVNNPSPPVGGKLEWFGVYLTCHTLIPDGQKKRTTARRQEGGSGSYEPEPGCSNNEESSSEAADWIVAAAGFAFIHCFLMCVLIIPNYLIKNSHPTPHQMEINRRALAAPRQPLYL